MIGDGTTGAPLKADVKVGSYPIVIADTATVDMGGDGTTGNPLKADVKANTVGIVFNDTTEVDVTGVGTTGSPLTAVLKGVRAGGDWTVADGSIVAGKAGSTTYRSIGVIRNISGVDMISNLGTSAIAGNGATIDVIESGVVKFTFTFDKLGQVTVIETATNAYRPLPFAMQVMAIPVTIASAVTGTTPVTFQSSPNRFTQNPVIVASPIQTAPVYMCAASSITPTSCNMGIRHVDNTAASVTITAQTIVIQMLSTATPGRSIESQIEEGAIPAIATCHTIGCENEGIPIDIHPLTLDTQSFCGVCSTFTDDVVARSGRKRHA